MPALTTDEINELADAVVARLTPDRREYFTVASLAELLALNPRSVQYMLTRGAIASYKVEGSRRIRPADVDAYLIGCRQRKAK